MCRNKTNNSCIYCNSTHKLTKDHVPPKCFFSDPKPSNLITVNCCNKCNASFDKDDEYMFTILNMRHDVSEHFSGKKHADKLKRLIQNPNKLPFVKSIIKSAQISNVSTRSGIYLGKAATYQPEGIRILKFMKRITAGIYYHETKRKLPLNNIYRLLDPINYYRQPELFKNTMTPLLDELIAKNKIVIGDNIFSYSYEILEDNEYAFISLFCFFYFVQYLCLSIPPPPKI